MLSIGTLFAAAPAAQAETRSLKLMFIHTGEKAEIVFKRNGRYDNAGLKKLNQFLRDWRRNEPTKMDPRLFDLVWEAYRATGSNSYINVVSAYRSPATNSMLRSRSKGVAKKSQHMLGKAMDFYIPGVPLKKLREIGLKMQGGGVGYYPTSGSPFVHFDVGNVRHWPKMSRRELVAIFPNGKTLHVPSDGKPLPGFQQAVAAYEARKKSGTTALALNSSGGGTRSGGLLAAFFGGGGADEEEESGGSEAVAEVSKPARPVRETVAAKPEAPKADNKIRVIPPELARPADYEIEQPKETIVAALPSRDVPLPALAPRPRVEVGAPLVDLNEKRAPLVDLSSSTAAVVPPAAVEAPVEVALGIPLPTRRPDYAPAAEIVTTAENAEKAQADELLLASADPADAAKALEEAKAIVNVSAPAAPEPVTASQALAAVVPLPSNRPAAAEAAFARAALPDTVDTLPQLAAYAPESDAFATAPEEVIAEPLGTKAASLRSVLKDGKADPASVVGTGVRTTTKTARPGSADAKPDRRPVVVAAQPHAARWALDGDYVANNTKGTKAPSYAYRIVTTAPREIYTAGFQQGDPQVSALNRFSGKAVTFLSVARFN